jgi:hypothetical protein
MRLVVAFCFAIGISLLSCRDKKKDEPVEPAPGPPPGASYDLPSKYMPLKVGNYWVYKCFDIDENGTFVENNRYDSTYVLKDTVIRNTAYHLLVGPLLVGGAITRTAVRDSFHFRVTSTGSVLFSTFQFSKPLHSGYATDQGDTLWYFETKMSGKDSVVFTPAGTFATVNTRTRYDIRAGVSTPTPVTRYGNFLYGKSTGLIYESIPFIMPARHMGRWLVRYKLN